MIYLMLLKYLSRTQSTINLLGARSVNLPPSSEDETCKGFIHMEYCSRGNSASSLEVHFCQISSTTKKPIKVGVEKAHCNHANKSYPQDRKSTRLNSSHVSISY